MTKVCLSMIVKNEAHVIRRGLDTVKPFIDYWVIVDTGSTDGTQQAIREHMKDIPGELHERPWQDFSHNRNEAIELARDKADYLMFLDADEEFVAPAGWRLPEMTEAGYRVRVDHPPSISYDRMSFVATRLPWRYAGVLHEVVECRQPHPPLPMLPDVFLRENPEGARSLDPQSGAKDAAVLEAALKEDPYNARYVFYLAQTYRGMDEWKKAKELYERRAAMGGYDQELFCAYFYAALCADEAQCDENTVMAAYLRAYQNRPARAEPLCELARYCRLRSQWSLAYLFARQAAAIPHPGTDERIFVYESVYAWRSLDEWAVAASWTGRWQETKELCERLLSGSALPAGERGRVQGNLELACSRLNVSSAIAKAA